MGYLKSISKFLVAGALFSSLFVTSAFASNLGKVTGDVVNLRSYNSTAGQLVSVAKKNDVLTIVANANNGWFEVTTADKKRPLFLLIMFRLFRQMLLVLLMM